MQNLSRLLAAARTAALELHLEVEAYNDANAQLEADAGMTAGTAANYRSLLNFVVQELTGAVINTIPAGQQTSTRQLTDQTA